MLRPHIVGGLGVLVTVNFLPDDSEHPDCQTIFFFFFLQSAILDSPNYYVPLLKCRTQRPTDLQVVYGATLNRAYKLLISLNSSSETIKQPHLSPVAN